MTPIFTGKHLPKGQAIDDGDIFEIAVDGITYKARVYVDDNPDRPDERDEGFWPSQKPEDHGYVGKNPKVPFKLQQQQAEARMEMWERSDWMYYGIAVTAWIDGVMISGEFEHALWGIEGNWPRFKGKPNEDRTNYLVDNQYFMEVASELANEAKEAMDKKLRRLLMPRGYKVMVLEHEGGSFIEIVYPSKEAIKRLEVNGWEEKHLEALSEWAGDENRLLGDYLVIEGSSLIAVIIRVDGPTLEQDEARRNE